AVVPSAIEPDPATGVPSVRFANPYGREERLSVGQFKARLVVASSSAVKPPEPPSKLSRLFAWVKG
ncbi:MAG: hypothetical protein ACT4TC_04380, partial [Myxococcaceae bacterium]